jgi:cell division septum initiation protein DivIVA
MKQKKLNSAETSLQASLNLIADRNRQLYEDIIDLREENARLKTELVEETIKYQKLREELEKLKK